MDITGIVTHGLGKDQIDQLDNRRIAGIIKQVRRLLDFREDGLGIFFVDIL